MLAAKLNQEGVRRGEQNWAAARRRSQRQVTAPRRDGESLIHGCVGVKNREYDHELLKWWEVMVISRTLCAISPQSSQRPFRWLLSPPLLRKVSHSREAACLPPLSTACNKHLRNWKLCCLQRAQRMKKPKLLKSACSHFTLIQPKPTTAVVKLSPCTGYVDSFQQKENLDYSASLLLQIKDHYWK